MGDNVNYSALIWLKKVLEESLKKACSALEIYVEDSDDEADLKKCAHEIHQVYSALQIAEIYGAALVAEEIELVLRALINNQISKRDEAITVLTGAIIQLPEYLSRLESGQKDVPLALMPLLNDLRAARNTNLVTESALFSPNMRPIALGADELNEVTVNAQLPEMAKRLRHAYHKGLLGWFRNQNTQSSLILLKKVIGQLQESSRLTPVVKLWWIAKTLTETLIHEGVESSVAVKLLMGQLDRQIKRLIDHGEQALAEKPVSDLYKNLLYYIARSTFDNALIGEVKVAFSLSTALPNEQELQTIQENFAGPNADIMSTVAIAIKEDLVSIKDRLDLFMRGGIGNVEELSDLGEPLRKIGDTLGMLGQGMLRKKILHQIDVLGMLQQHGGTIGEERLMELAGDLLYIESAIDGLQAKRFDPTGQMIPGLHDSDSNDGDEFVIPEGEYQEVLNVTLQEITNEVSAVKELILMYLDAQGDENAIASVQEKLAGVQGAFYMLRLIKASALIEGLSAAVQTHFHASGVPEDAILDHIANAVNGIEYYIDGVYNYRFSDQYMLGVAQENIEAIGQQIRVDEPNTAAESTQKKPKQKQQSPRQETQKRKVFQPVAEQTPPMIPVPVTHSPPLLEDIDAEILEIFMEEAREQQEMLEENYPRWKNNHDKEALSTIRRAFHTLKGSGRLVGAMLIGEFAWAVENMLNRLIDGTVPGGPPLFKVMDDVVLALPVLIDCQEKGLQPEIDINSIIERAENVAQRKAEPEPVEPTEPELDAATATITMDAVLYDIFTEETSGHLQAIQHFIDACRQTHGCECDDSLVRSVHTLHGSAHMAEVSQIALLSAELEKLVKVMLSKQARAGEDFIALVVEATDVIKAIIASINQKGAILPDYEAVIDKIQAEMARIEQAAPVESRTEEVSIHDDVEKVTAEIDRLPVSEPEIVAQEAKDAQSEHDDDIELERAFLEESGEIIDEMEQVIQKWTKEPTSTALIQDLHRSLHTLKGSARLAGFIMIGDVSHALESLLTGIDNRTIEINDVVINLAHQAVDTLEKMRDVIVTGAQPEPASALLAQIDEALAGETTNPIDTFLEDCGDIIDKMTQISQKWTQDPTDKELILELNRALHPLKDGARAAGLSMIGDVSQSLESLLTGIDNRKIDINNVVIDLVQQAVDDLARMRDVLATGVLPDVTIGLLTNIDDALAGKIEDEPDAKAQTGTGGQDLRDKAESVKIRSDLLDTLVNYAGEISIYRSRLEQQNGSFVFNLSELDQTVTRLRNQLRNLEIETEAQIIFRYEEEREEEDVEEFDPLEMDRFSKMQQISRSLMESVTDLISIQEMMTNLSRESETLLLQQARVNTELQEGLMRTRMVPFSSIMPKLSRLVRQTSGEVNKKAELEVIGAAGEMDRTIMNRMVAPLEHMLRNAVSHGIEDSALRLQRNKPEMGKITLQLTREGTDIVLYVADDGGGIDVNSVRNKALEKGLMTAQQTDLSEEDILQFILEAGFSTAQEITQVSGRGVGMDVVNSEIKQLGGSLHIDSQKGHGTLFTVRLPFTLAINQALLVQIADETYAIPHSSIEGVVRLSRDELEKCYSGEKTEYEYASNHYHVQYIGAMLGAGHAALQEKKRWFPVLLVRTGQHRIALQVDAILGNREIVVKSVGPQVSTVNWVSGATVMGDGRVVLILDVSALVRHGTVQMAQDTTVVEEQPEERTTLTVMVVDDSITVRKVTTRLLERHEMNVFTAKDGVDAIQVLQEQLPDIMLLDVEMPRMDGYELARHIRNSERLKDIPIIMITSRTGEKHRKRAMEIGVNTYLGKPYQEAELLENIHALIGKSG